jgi:hypothetical protein
LGSSKYNTASSSSSCFGVRSFRRRDKLTPLLFEQILRYSKLESLRPSL